jgi:hypothetical protein
MTNAHTFLRMLGNQHTFQTFDDSPRKERGLSRILHGTLAEHAVTLAALNTRGAGVFVMVNEGDGEGRSKANVVRVRALFVDLDGAPLEPVKAGPLAPHCIVETSPGRWHAYWRLADCPLQDFTPLQRALAARFNADSKVCDLARVMRVPGFDHCKREPFRSRIVEYHERAPYTVVEMRAAFGFDIEPARATTSRTLPARIPEGERNDCLFSLARGLVQRGIDADGVNHRLQRINAERCTPPLCAVEVDTIAANACAYGANGFAAIPRALVYSGEWKALSSAARTVVVLAYCRDNGAPDCTFALTETDFSGWIGISKNPLHNAIAELLAAGILVRVAESRNTQTGRKPALYVIATKWRFRQGHNQTLAPRSQSDPLHRKQPLGESFSAPGLAKTKTDKAA